tara:strand:+ start:337 stop:612 length:276 start_codon:yes stop_codon:yes gene_type:complete
MSQTDKLVSYQGRKKDTLYSADCQWGKPLNCEMVQGPPAWLVAQWLLARKNDQPISDIANKYCDKVLAGTNNKALQWYIQNIFGGAEGQGP